MKWVIYTLLLLNLVFVLWHYRTSNDAARTSAVEQSEEAGQRLVLLKEYQAQQAALEKNQPQESTPSQGDGSSEAGEPIRSRRCYSLGPFAKKSLAKKVAGRLQRQGIKTQSRVNRESKQEGYWVFLPPYESRRAANTVVKRLKAMQVQDYFLVATGSQKNAISLGVFSRSSLAKKRLKEMQALGLTPSLDKVKLPHREYWLDWPLSSHAKLSGELLATLTKATPGIGHIERNCAP